MATVGEAFVVWASPCIGRRAALNGDLIKEGSGCVVKNVDFEEATRVRALHVNFEGHARSDDV